MKRVALAFLCILCGVGAYIVFTPTKTSWSMVSEQKNEGYNVVVLEAKTVTWPGPKTTDHSTWSHPIRLVIPDQIESNDLLLFVKGGKRGASLPSLPPELISGALKTKMVVAEIFSVPNQPYAFEDGNERSEDALVAYSWKQFLNGEDAKWPLLTYMASAVTSSLDVLTEVLKEKIEIKGFVLSGESKRGWTTYLAGIKDDRIKGVVPVVADFLNVRENFYHHFKSLGSWSPVISDYLELGINETLLNHPRFMALMDLEDPYTQRDKLLLPKYLVHASGDPFSMPDATRTYFNELKGDTFLRLLPNCGHKVAFDEYYPSLMTFTRLVSLGSSIPKLTWQVEDGKLRVESSVPPKDAKVWHTSNEDSRDFRFDFTSCRWDATPLFVEDEKNMVVDLMASENGWNAHFVELTYETSEGPLILTTEAIILPDSFPKT